jgi:hypothetical protein
MYDPGPAPSGLSVQAVWDELQRIRSTLELMQINHLEFKKHYQPPKKPIEGRMYYADGTTWNPGSGRGLYIYIDGWIPITTTVDFHRPLAGSLKLTGFAPYVHTDQIINQVPSSNLTLTGTAPTTYIKANRIPAALLTLTTFTPTISVTP